MRRGTRVTAGSPTSMPVPGRGNGANAGAAGDVQSLVAVGEPPDADDYLGAVRNVRVVAAVLDYGGSGRLPQEPSASCD